MNLHKFLSAILIITVLFISASTVLAQEDNLRPPTIDMVSWEDTGFPLPNPLPAKYQYILLYDAKPLAASEDKVYGDNVDRAPLFAEHCLSTKDPEACSNEAIEAFVKENINYPDAATRKNHDGIEHVLIVINEFGKIDGRIKVVSKDNPCAGCTQAAVDVVSKMNYWVPARKDGLAVKAKLIIPIQFETVSYAR